MSDPRAAEHDEVLPAPVADRLLKRASELDAARRAGTAVAELRAAAAEAGISSHAFDTALGELQKAEQAPAPAAVAGARRWRGLFIGLATVGSLALFAGMIVIPTRVAHTGPVAAEQSIELKCMSTDAALELARRNGGTLVKVGPSSRTIVVHAAPQDLDRIRSAIARADDNPSCARH